ncbi:MAG: hypothetical protein NZ480_08935 [Bdellovibrionaceae bacterium]|nr:hypothetical protein [Pseudobdellovibrionaceae bacterium]MDW8189404.1 hypothetical protein [Pseudobdellovibrionaceae bacterium]
MIPRSRILLLFDDHIISDHWQIFLQKMGFVVEVLRSDAGIKMKLLDLNPNAVIVLARGIHLHLDQVLKKLSQETWFKGKILVCEMQSHPINLGNIKNLRFDGVLTLDNVSDEEKLEVLAQLLDLDYQMLIDKYRKSIAANSASSTSQQSLFVRPTGPSSGGSASMVRPLNDYVTKQKKKWVNGQVPGFKIDDIKRQFQQHFVEDVDPSILEEKKRFVNALFKKKTK